MKINNIWMQSKNGLFEYWNNCKGAKQEDVLLARTETSDSGRGSKSPDVRVCVFISIQLGQSVLISPDVVLIPLLLYLVVQNPTDGALSLPSPLCLPRFLLPHSPSFNSVAEGPYVSVYITSFPHFSCCFNRFGPAKREAKSRHGLLCKNIREYFYLSADSNAAMEDSTR